MKQTYKKITSVLLAVVMLAVSGCFTIFSASAADCIYGDADGSTQVDIKDVLCMQKYIAKMISENEIDRTAANVTADDTDVNTQDVLYVQQFIARMIDRFPIEKEPKPDTVKLIFNVTIPEVLPEDAHVSIGSNLNGWNPADTAWFAEKIDDLHYKLEKDVDQKYAGTTIAYKWTVQIEGQENMWAQVEGGATGGDIEDRTYDVAAGTNEINDTVAMFRSLTESNTVVGGTLETFTMVMHPYEDNRERTIRVWLPDGYDQNTEKKYPVLYMQDGQNVFDSFTSFAGEWKVDEAVTDMIAGGYEGAIVVGIDNGPQRMAEYCPDDWPGSDQTESGSKYAAFLAQTLKPYIDEHYRTKTDKDNTIVGGSSMGGLISYYIGQQYPDVFGNVLVFSPSFQLFGEANVAQMIAQQDFSDADALPRYFIYAGGIGGEGNITKYVDFTKNAMVANGYPEEKINTFVDTSQPHSESAWAKYFPQAYSWLVGFEGEPPVEKDFYRIYLDTSYSDWTDAYIAMWTGGTKVEQMIPVTGQPGVYYYDLPNGQESFLFRADDVLSEWGSKASVDVSFRPANENMVYTFTSGGGEDKYAGAWRAYVPPQKDFYTVYFDVSYSDWTQAYIATWIGGSAITALTPVENKEGVYSYNLPKEQVEFMLYFAAELSGWGPKASVNISFTPENENMVYVFNGVAGDGKYSGQWQAYTP